MPGTAPRLAALLWALLIALTPAAAAWARPVGSADGLAAWARPVGSADGPADVALAVGLTTAAATATGLWLRSQYRREEAEHRGSGGDGGDQ
ncbi:hypothetical protein AB0F18_30550 [Streptomyces sp. NPDC029216]|uniref:hypothetical protein n=1 Tax=Streptomyces sp. NPDC029216 TaxID=3154701 RepID=UPI0033D20A51